MTRTAPPQPTLADKLDYADAMAKRDALRSIARDLPNPAAYARYMSRDVADALLRASTKRRAWCALEDDAPLLRSYGLCGFNGLGLTGFGISVRRALAGDDD